MQKSKDISGIKEILKGSLTGLLALTFFSVLFSFLILKTGISNENYFTLLIITAALSGIICGFTAVRKKREKGIICGLLSSLLPSILLISAMSIAFNGFSGFEMIPALTFIVGGTIGGIISVNIKKNNKIKHKTR